MAYVKPNADRILDAAERVFVKQGYGATSLRDLMAAAEVSTTAFYARFDSKEAVLGALLERLLADIYAAGSSVLSQTRDVEEGFERGVDVLVQKLARRKGLVRLILTQYASSPTSLASFRQTLEPLADMLAARLQRLVDRGDIEVADPRALGWALVGALHMQVVRWAVFDEVSGRGLRAALRSTARALLPAAPPKRQVRRPRRSRRPLFFQEASS